MMENELVKSVSVYWLPRLDHTKLQPIRPAPIITIPNWPDTSVTHVASWLGCKPAFRVLKKTGTWPYETRHKEWT